MDDTQARQLLARERERIERALPELERSEEDGEPTPEPEDSSDQLDPGIAAQLREELDAVERAERRLQDGTYGRSVDSGEPIPDGRLEAIPWAERTAAEQERLERGR